MSKELVEALAPPLPAFLVEQSPRQGCVTGILLGAICPYPFWQDGTAPKWMSALAPSLAAEDAAQAPYHQSSNSTS